MKKIPPPPIRDLEIDQTPQDGIEQGITPHNHEINITEGGEFLDDALRMEDLNKETKNKPSAKVCYKHLF